MTRILYSDGSFSINSFDDNFELQFKILEKGWYYIDNSVIEYAGPFESEIIAEQEMERYLKFLESEPKINQAA
jgi:hypothetical protein